MLSSTTSWTFTLSIYNILVVFPTVFVFVEILKHFAVKYQLRRRHGVLVLLLFLSSLYYISFTKIVPLWLPEESENAYSILNVNRLDSSSKWAQQYVRYRKLHKMNKMNSSEFKRIDEAYDMLYDDLRRKLYDSSGVPGLMYLKEVSSKQRVLFSIEIMSYYIVWLCTVLTFTTSFSSNGARSTSIALLLALFTLDMFVRHDFFDPGYTQHMTPHEMVYLAQRLFPVLFGFLFGYANIVYLDTLSHRNHVLKRMLASNKELQHDADSIMKELCKTE